MAGGIEFWGAGTARTLRPIWMAEELGLEYRLHRMGPRTGETQTEAFTKLSRKQKIPLMREGGLLLSESLAICRYLRQAHPGAAVAEPRDLAARAKEDEWCSYIYGELDETALYVMRRHHDLTEIYGEAPQAVEVCRAYLARHLEVLDHHLAGREALLDGGFGLADILLVSCLDWARLYAVPLPENVEAYRAAVAQRPAYRKAMAINYEDRAEREGVRDGAA